MTGTSGAGITLLCGEISQFSGGVSDELSVQLEELQYTVGEGPTVDAWLEHRPVLEPDLADPASPRWPGFASVAVRAGVRAIFCFPLQVDSISFGVLNLYRARSGLMSLEQQADALAMADVVAEAILLAQAEAPCGVLAAELTIGANMRSAVHHAAGMMSTQLDISVAQAILRLRAFAFGNERRLVEVATDVVDRHLRFDDRTKDGTVPVLSGP